MLGPLEVVLGGVPVAVGGTKARALLAFLLLHRGEPVGRERLVDALWGERPPQTVATELRVYVAKLRKALRTELLETRQDGYVLLVAPEQVDAERFERAARRGSALLAGGEAEEAARTLAEAQALWRGPVLADLGDLPWVEAEARRLDELRLVALEERLEAELALGRHAAAVAELQRLVVEHPYRERLRAQLMLALYRSGRQTESLAVYRETAHLFAEELGIEPGPELRARERAVLTHDASLRLADLAAGNLAAPPTGLIGRQRELAELSALLSRPETRLVTLTGPAGAGKTRLALELAAHLGRDRGVPAFLVELAPLTEPGLVLPTIARTVGCEEDGRGALVERLRMFLRHRQLLVVLDNFEHLLDAGRDVSALLAAVPGLTVLATSRSPLYLRGEWRYGVAPLPLEDAVALFVERARAVEISLEPDADIETLCKRLDRLPLAIELAAARVEVSTPAEILVGLSRRFDLIGSGPRDAPERQRTLRATIEWSYQLLDEKQQEVFDRLGVFAGGCTLEAAEQICQTDPDTLASLVDTNLLRYGGGRYSMLETIREYAAERLHERGFTDAVSRALAEYLLVLVQEGTGRIRNTPPPAALRTRLEAEVDNLRAAIAWAFATDDVELATQLAIEARWSAPEGFRLEQRRWLQQALAAAGSACVYTRAHALLTAGILEYLLGDFERARRFLEQSLPRWRELDDDRAWIRNLRMLGIVVGSGFGDDARAAALLQESLALAERTSDRRGIYIALHSLGEREIRLGHLKSASALLARAAELARDADDPHLTGVLQARGDVALAQRDVRLAFDLYAEALELSASRRDSRDSMYSLIPVAAVAAVAGDIERAGRLSGAIETLEREADFPLFAQYRGKYDDLIEPCAEAAPVAFTAARERGRSMSLEDAIAYALRGRGGRAQASTTNRETSRL
jgi:predicted ATPase/DNA-binding SARP family transcriptional activator